MLSGIFRDMHRLLMLPSWTGYSTVCDIMSRSKPDPTPLGVAPGSLAVDEPFLFGRGIHSTVIVLRRDCILKKIQRKQGI
jgi:hypothetical protein